MVRSIEGGEGRRRGFDGEVELVGARAGGGGVLGFLGRERAKEQGELVEGVLVVPLRAKFWALGLCPELSMAVARWRPAGARCCVARQGRHSAKAKSGGGGRARRVGRQHEQEVAGLALHGGNGAEQRRRGAEQAGRLEEGEKGSVCNFRNFRDLTVN